MSLSFIKYCFLIFTFGFLKIASANTQFSYSEEGLVKDKTSISFQKRLLELNAYKKALLNNDDYLALTERHFESKSHKGFLPLLFKTSISKSKEDIHFYDCANGSLNLCMKVDYLISVNQGLVSIYARALLSEPSLRVRVDEALKSYKKQIDILRGQFDINSFELGKSTLNFLNASLSVHSYVNDLNSFPVSGLIERSDINQNKEETISDAALFLSELASIFNESNSSFVLNSTRSASTKRNNWTLDIEVSFSEDFFSKLEDSISRFFAESHEAKRVNGKLTGKSWYSDSHKTALVIENSNKDFKVCYGIVNIGSRSKDLSLSLDAISGSEFSAYLKVGEEIKAYPLFVEKPHSYNLFLPFYDETKTKRTKESRLSCRHGFALEKNYNLHFKGSKKSVNKNINAWQAKTKFNLEVRND